MMSVSNLLSSHCVGKSSTTQHLSMRMKPGLMKLPETSRHMDKRHFFDVKVFNPFAKFNQKFALASCFTHHERQKKRAYEQRVVEVENGSFTPLVFSTTGGMGKLASIFYSRLAMMLSEKRQQPFSTTTGWLRCQLSFSLLRSSILCIRGSRSSHHVIPRFPISTDLATNESRVALY